MDLLNSLLDALVRLQGDALVMHPGEKPYVVTTSPGTQARGARTWGQVELSSRILTHDLVSTMAAQILPAPQRRALDELGAIEHEIPPPAGVGDRFTVVAARGGDDIWLEVRRQAAPRVEPPAPAPPPHSAEEAREMFEHPAAGNGAPAAEPAEPETPPEAGAAPPPAVDALLTAVDEATESDRGGRSVTDASASLETSPTDTVDLQARAPVDEDRTDRPADSDLRMRAAAPREPAGSPRAQLESLLRAAVARGASMVYLVAGTRPMARIRGEFGGLEGFPAFPASDIEQMLRWIPSLDEEPPQADRQEWVAHVADVGRVRCMRFSDHRGPGAIFRLVPASAISADQLRLPDDVRELCSTDGVLIVTGDPGSGKSTLLHGIVDLINRMRSDHVVTIEPRIHFVHGSERSFISQREPGCDQAAVAAAVREALREDPDVVVIEDVASADVAAAALQVVHAGRLIVLSVAASSPVHAITALLDFFPQEDRGPVQGALATELRAVISQTLVRNATGGRTPAREVVFNTPSVSTLVREGRLTELRPAAAGNEGHVTLDAALASLVRDGIVSVAEACRKATDRAAFVRTLQGEGIDTTFAEKLA